MKRGLQTATTTAEQAERRTERPDVLSQVEVCARLGICDQTWMNWRKAGLTPQAIVLPNGGRKWRTADIDALVGRRETDRPGRRFFGAARAAAVR